ncbi:MAG: hypothetical protein ACYTEX_11050 [Planctomycetota bacterium]
MTDYHKRQLADWVDGKPWCEEGQDCCPDFACCRGVETIAPQHERERFALAVRDNDEEAKMKMLMGFLGRALAGHNVHIAGDEANTHEDQ